MDLLPIIPLIPGLIEAGKSIIELVKPFIKGNGFELPQDLENKIAELEKDKNATEIIALLKDFAKNCNSQTITQTNNGLGAMNIVGNPTINQTITNQKQGNPDINLFIEISTDFSDDFVYFIKNQNFGCSFEDKDTDALSNLLHKYDNPKYQFINEALKDKWNMLFKSLKKFDSCIDSNTFELRKGRQRVEPENNTEAIEMLNSLATDVYKKYDEFIASGKQILNV